MYTITLKSFFRKTLIFLAVLLGLVLLLVVFSKAYFRYDQTRIRASLSGYPAYFQDKAVNECAQIFPDSIGDASKSHCLATIRQMNRDFVVQHVGIEGGGMRDELISRSDYIIELAAEKKHVEEVREEYEQLQKEDDNQAVYVKSPGRSYPITDGKTYRIIPGRKYVCEDGFWAESRYQEILEVKVYGKWKEMYRVKDLGDGRCSTSEIFYEKSIRISPQEDYVEFSLVGWEWSENFILNTRTRQSVLESGVEKDSLLWSKNARNYTFRSVFNAFGGEGRDAVWVSSFNRPDKPVSIFDLKDWSGGDPDSFMKYAIRDLKFIDNETVEFAVFNIDEHDNSKVLDELARYRYGLQSGKLKEIFRKTPIVFVTNIDEDINRWQSKETNLFLIKFPKEWFWKVLNGSSDTYVITNNQNFDISKYPEIGITDDRVAVKNESEIVLSFYSRLTAQLDEPEKSTEDIIKKFLGYIMQSESQSRCVGGLIDNILVCTDEQGQDRYYIAGRKTAIVMTVHKAENSVLAREITDKIAYSLVVK